MIGRLFKAIIGHNVLKADLLLPKNFFSKQMLQPNSPQHRSVRLRITPAFDQSKTPPSNHFSSKAYQFFGSAKHWVPSEKTIDDHIAKLLAGFNLAPQIAIHRYQGKAQSHLAPVTPLSQYRDQHYCQVHRLSLFRTYHSLPDMEYGVDIQHDPDLINRCLIITHKHAQIILGAVYFTIDLQHRQCYLHAIQIDSMLQNKGLGSLLMHCVVNIALLYYCSMVHLTSIDNAVNFYQQMGFQLRTEGSKKQLVLDFIQWPQEMREKYLASVDRISPSFNVQGMIAQVGALYPKASIPFTHAVWYSLRGRFKNSSLQ